MCLSKLFRKKKKNDEIKWKKASDFDKYVVKVNIKTMCAYEAFTGKPFLAIETEEDVIKLFYCSFVVNNSEFADMDYETFCIFFTNPAIAQWFTKKYEKLGVFAAQFKSEMSWDGDAEETGDAQGNDSKAFYMTEAAAGMIVRMGIDAHYVMYEMEQWEIAEYFSMMKDVNREKLSWDRLFTYLEVVPHVGKKLGSPEKMLPFPWEEGQRKRKAEKALKENEHAIKTLIGKKLDFIK